MLKPYPAEFRRQALALVASGRMVVDVAASLGIAQSCLCRWKQQDLIDHGLKDGPSQAESAELAAALRLPKLHPCSSSGMFVLVEDSVEPVSSADVQVDDSLWIGDRDGDGAPWSCLAMGLVGSVLVVEPFVLAQGMA